MGGITTRGPTHTNPMTITTIAESGTRLKVRLHGGFGFTSCGYTTVAVGTTETLTAQWNTSGVNPGVYRAIATVVYDENTATTEVQFKVGELLIKIVDVVVEDIVQRSIGRFDIQIESFWNELISDVYAEVKILDGETVIESIKTESVDMEPWAKKTIKAYWDTKGVEVGSYDARVILHYADKTTEERVTVNVVKFRRVLFNVAIVAVLAAVIALAVVLFMRAKERKRAAALRYYYQQRRQSPGAGQGYYYSR